MNNAIAHISRIPRFLAFFLVLSGFCLQGYGQTAGDYRSRRDDDWNKRGTWQRYNGSNWVNAGDYPGQSAGAGTVTVQHSVRLNVSPGNPIGSLLILQTLYPDGTDRNLEITNDLTISGGFLSFSQNDNIELRIYLGGNLAMTGGTMTENRSYGEVNFTGTGIQTFTKTGGTISNDIRFTVNSGSVLDMGSSVLDGSSGSFTLSTGAGLITAHPEGISSSGATGSVQVSGTRSYSTGAGYIYNGSMAQITGSGLPATVDALTIDNTAGVTLTSAVSVSGTLSLADGILDAGSNTVSITGTSPSAVTGSSSSFVNVTSGSFRRNLPANLSGTGNNYLFPIGEGGSYKGINLIDVNTGATGPLLSASVSPTGALTADNVTVSIIEPRYWSLLNLNGGDFSGASVELYESGLNISKTVCMAPAPSGDYSAVGGTPGVNSIISPPLPNPGPYFAIGVLEYDIFYSYKSGDWHDPETWTSDPSGTLQIGNQIPGEGAMAIILTDRTVTLSQDVTEAGLAVSLSAGAFLDQSIYRFSGGLSSLAGQGTLKLASADFPVVLSNTLVGAGGGTVEYYNSSDFTLPVSQTIYNNLTINTSGAIATQLNDLTLNGNLHVRSGTFRINDNSGTARRSITVNGNVTVESGGSITVGNGVTNSAIGGTGGTPPFLNYYLNFHTVIIRGDFTNNGTVRFTNLDHPVFNAFPPTTPGATSGAASVYFEGAADNTLTCNGITDFYNLILNKGTDQTYNLTVSSSSYSNFRLFGANTLAAEAVTSNPAMRKALWIYSGTLILKGNVVIPSLSEGSSGDSYYYIPASGALVADGVDVVILSTADDYREVNAAYGVSASGNAAMGVNTAGTASALYVFGRLQVNSGFLSAKESGGIITSSTASGQVVINGGVVDAKQFLSSTGSASYSQSGGLFILRGRFQRTPVAYTSVSNLSDISAATLNTSRATSGINSSYGSFNLENATNIYTVSGGTIRILDVTTTGVAEAFDVKSSAANINVTGGTLEMIPTTGTGTDATDYSIHSTAPLFNLTVNRASGVSVVRMSTPVTVLHDLSLTSGALNANSNNLTIGGDFTLEAGTTYAPGTNITMLNGSEAQVLTVNHATPLVLSSLAVEKPAGTVLTLAGSQNSLNISSAFRLAAGTLNDGGKTVNVAGSVFNSGIATGTGKITLNGFSPQTIDGGGLFGNIELANTASSPVTLLDNMTVSGALTFSADNLLDIGTFNLHLESTATIINGGSARFVQSAGNAGDGGVSRSWGTTDSFVFPVGVAGRYTPATIGFTSAPSTYGSVTVIPVDYEHPVTTVNGQSLSYFWRVKSDGFADIPLYSVTHSFIYSNTDVAGSEAAYVPALYDGVAYSWYTGTTSDVNTTTNTISDWTAPTNSTNFLDADYTAGSVACFGTPRIYYSRQSGLWSSLSTWSLTGHSADDPPTTAPGANDIVIIGDNDSIYLSNEAFPLGNDNDPSTTYFERDKAVVNCATLEIEAGSVLDIQNNPGCTFASVLSHSGGNGKIRITTRDPDIGYWGDFDNPEPFVYPNGDFSEFSVNDGISEFYTINPQSGTYYILPSNASAYGTVIMTPLKGSNVILPNIPLVTINGDLICNGSDADAWLAMSWTGEYGTIVEKTVDVEGDLIVSGGSFGFIYNGTRLQRINIAGDVYVSPGAGIDVWNSSTNNIMSIGGSLYNNSDNSVPRPSGSPSVMRFLSGSNRCDLIFTGNSSSVVTNDPALSTTPVTVFNNVTIDKGNSPDTTITWNIGGTLTTPTNNWLTLLNGTLVYDRTGNFNISTVTDFTIPATAGVTLNTPSNVYISNSSSSETLYLNGRLRILTGGGNVYIGPSGNTADNADIEYSGSGASLIEVQSGNLFVNGQVRRPAASTNGTLKYRQSGGNVVIYGNNASAVKAKLEVLNDNSEFTMSGGTLTVARGGGTTFGDLYLRPASGSVTGGTVVFSQAPATGTVIDAAQSYLLDASIALNDLEVRGKTAGTDRDADLSLMVSPLVLNGSLTISNGRSSFSTNNRNVTIRGNMVNSGSWYYGTSRTIFDGGVQSVTGSSVTDFYDLEVSALTSLTTNGSFTVNNDLDIVSGNLVLGSGLVTVIGDLANNGAYTDDNVTGGVRLGGATQQIITGNGSFARLVLDNSSGARISNDIILQHDLVIERGILDINKYLLTLSQNSLISGTGFRDTKMIRSDGVSSSRGVLKYFPAGAQTFTFPVGVSGKYTPALLTVNASSTVGSVRINPVNESHPTVADPLNTLGYYWQTESAGISGFDASLQFSYLADDVSGDEAQYVAARLVIPGNTWDKAQPGAATDNVNESAHTVSFWFTGTNNLNGDYTAGTDSAIPYEVAEYVTNSDGDWSDPGIWTPVGASPPPPAGGPRGCNVIIDHVVTADINFISVLNTVLNNELRLVAPTYGHNLGNVTGDGKIYLEGGNLPGGTWDEFTDCSGDGTIEYGGSGTYTIVSGVYSSVPNLIFSGTGTRILPNADLTVCRRLVIDGPLLDNSVNNRKLTILGTFERYNTGAFSSGTGTYPAATVSFSGSAVQSLGGVAGNFSGSNRFHNLEINNPAGLTLNDGSDIEIANQLMLANGVISVSPSGRLMLLSTSSSAVIPAGGSAGSWVSGPLTKNIINGDSFLFPVGRGSIRGHRFTLVSTAGSTAAFTAEYFSPNNTATSIAPPLEVANTLEYWSISSASPASARVRIGWDPQSDLTPLVTVNGLADMRVAGYSTGMWRELASTASGDNNNGTVETTGSVSVTSTPSDFTTASISGTLARASFSSFDPICGSGGIPVSFISFSPISLNYFLSYSIDGVPQPDITVTSLPFTLPAVVPGVYRLTGFRFNGGSNTGVVDANTVTVYELPTTADAGGDQSLCGLSTTTLNGNDPGSHAGLWTVVSGAGGSFENSVLFNTVFNGVLGVSYTLRWTISNGPCDSFDEVVISFPVVASQPGEFADAETQVCQGGTGYVYTVPFVSGVIYDWYYSGTGETINGTGNTVTVDFDASATGGTLSVTATNACGTSPARTVGISIITASFAYTGSPYCQNQPNPTPLLDAGSLSGTFTSTPGLVFADSSTGEIDLSASASGVYTVTNTLDASVCGGLSATAQVTVGGQTWTGAADAEWNNPANWSCGFVPWPITSVVIPAAATAPVISSGTTAETADLTVEAGGSLTISDGTLLLYASVTGGGVIDATNGTVEYTGTEPQDAGAALFSGSRIKNLTVNNASGVTLNDDLGVSGIVLVQNGTLSSGGHLTLLSDAFSTALVDGSGAGQITGNITMQRYLPSGFGYKYFSSPFVAAAVDEFGDDVNLGASFPPLFMFDENSSYSGWDDYVGAGSILNPLEGYALNLGDVADPKTVDLTGVLTNGELSVTLYNHNQPYTEGFNLVGNPYPSPIDWAGPGWTRSGIDNAVYYFRASTTDQYGGSYSSFVNGVSSDGQATGIIPSMQGFFVHVSDGVWPVTGTLTVTNSARINDLTHPFLKSSAIDTRFLVRVTAAFTDDVASADPLVICFDDGANDGFDGTHDALKLLNTDMMIANFYSVVSTGRKLSVNSLPYSNDTAFYIPLGLTIYRDGEVSFRIRDAENLPVNENLFFRDNVTGANVNLLGNSEYRIELKQGEYHGRFSLAFVKNATSVPDPAVADDLFHAWISEGIVKVRIGLVEGDRGLVSIYNFSGMQVSSETVYEPGDYNLSARLMQGVYIVTYTTGSRQRSIKLVQGK